EVLRPGLVRRTVDDDVPNAPGAELLRDWGKAQVAVDLRLREQLLDLLRWHRNPRNVAVGVEAHIRRHTREKHVLRAAQLGYGHGLPFEVGDRADTVGADQFEAADVRSGKNDDRIAGIDPQHEWSGELQGDVQVTGGQRRGVQGAVDPHVL